jgi:glycosyltransferase involved in cell wall biosynthesis
MVSHPSMTDLSIVIATRNRAQFLSGTLDSLSRIRSALKWEVIFVDNASSDPTTDVLESFQNSNAIPVQILKEPRPGAGRARNVGWRAAKGEIVGFIDDDCYPGPDYIEQVSKCFAAPEVGFIGGRVLLHDPTDLRITIQERTEPLLLPAGRFIFAGVLQGANWAVRRRALEEVGGFDPNLGPGTPFVCEEVELQARLSANGWVGAFEPGPTVYHHHRRKSRKDLGALQRTYDFGRGAYYAKCLLDPRLRRSYAKQWLYMVPSAPLSRIIREVAAAAHYFWLRAWGKLEFCP